MALPTLTSHWPGRIRPMERHLVRQREQESRRLQQWQAHSQYFKEQQVRSSKQAHWSSREFYQRSMSAFRLDRLQDERMRSLEERRERLRSMLQEENVQLEKELRTRNTGATVRQQQDRAEALRSAREERRKKLAQDLLKEHWKKNNPELRNVESELHKDHVVSQWQVQQQHKKQAEEQDAQERLRFENEYERSRKEALERMKEEEERRKKKESEKAEFLRQQMEELKIRDEESRRLQQEEDTLLSKRLELDQLEEDRRRAEDGRKKSEFGRLLSRQYRAQLKRRAQQVQEELGEEEERRAESVRRERAVADVAWMKGVLEEQLQLEREREAEFDLLHREEAQRVWDQREAQWERERKARERLMQEVLGVRQEQLQERMEEKRRARKECQRRRTELLQQLEEEEEEKRQQREQQEQQRTTRMQDINAQVAQKRREQWEEQQRFEQEEAELREGLRLQEKELRTETERMTRRGYEERVRGSTTLAVKNVTRVDLGHGSSSGSDGHLLLKPRGDALTFPSCREATIKRKRPVGVGSRGGLVDAEQQGWGTRPYAGPALQHYTPASSLRTLSSASPLTHTAS
ncbi:Trichoplein keratin filament-binding protein [Bagarius yarrelli]|uniref:Trichoplein keratin filament-binding protein n=1 Tax=Bagarius yarrelli TaxID=175774 RepID=A0A556V0W8_BAGYA|nr:Trichoplein keratin filament-binding protein [Bagarius yarrelli]